MENFRILEDQDIDSKLGEKIAHERKITLEILHLLREAERRQLYAKYGYPSLFEYATKRLGYSSGAAFGRIEAMRLIKDLPEVEDKIISGELSLSAVSQAQSFFKTQKRKSNPVKLEKKREIVNSLIAKSSREIQAELCKLSRESSRPQMTRKIAENKTRLTIEFTQEEIDLLEKLKAQLSHKNPAMGWAELFMEMAKVTDKKLNPTPRKQESTSAPKSNISEANRTTSAPKTKSQINRKTRRIVFQKAQDQCIFVSPITGKRCGSKHLLEYDHRIPRALGGTNRLENLRVYCRAHNILAATQWLGKKQMEKYVPSLR